MRRYLLSITHIIIDVFYIIERTRAHWPSFQRATATLLRNRKDTIESELITHFIIASIIKPERNERVRINTNARE